MTDLVLIFTTVPDDERAGQLARRLVDERLAACVNLYPAMTSHYHWQGKLEEDSERQMVIKTTRERVAALSARLAQLHTYELPEFLVAGVADATDAELKWVKDETS